MIIKSVPLVIHELRDGLKKDKSSSWFAFKCLNDVGDNRYITFFVSEEVYNSVKRFFKQDLPIKVDLDLQVFNGRTFVNILQLVK